MNNRAVTLSLVMAAIAVFFVYSYVEGVKEEVKNKFGDKILVVKAKRDIKEQETIDPESMLRLEAVPQQFLEPGAVALKDKTDEKDRQSALKELAGAVAIVPIRAGEQVTYNKLTEPGIRTGLAPQITPGKRAIAIAINDVSGVAKLIKPGDRVDVIAVFVPSGKKENAIGKTLFQDIVVLSIGKHVTNNVARIVERDPYTGKEKSRSLNEDTSFSSVTLEVDPQQAQMLAVTASSAENAITLSLRNNDDTTQMPQESTTVGDLIGADAYKIQRDLANQPRR